MSKYTMEYVTSKYPHIDGTPRGRVYALGVVADLHKSLDESEYQRQELQRELYMEREIHRRVIDSLAIRKVPNHEG